MENDFKVNSVPAEQVFGIKSKILFVFGWFCVGLGAIGAFLPLLPTTPFLLLALWAFSRCSPKFQSWLWSHTLFGPYVRNWVMYHAIPLKAKLLAIFMMSLSFGWMVIYSNFASYLIVIVGVCLGCAATYVLSRPTM